MVFVCVCLCVCVCNKCLINFNSFLAFSRLRLLLPFFLSYYRPRYTPTPPLPYIYADYYSICLSIYPSTASDAPLFNPSMARAVPSMNHASAQVTAWCATLCPKGHRGVGCWTSLSLVTSLPSQIHTIKSIPTSAFSWVVELSSSMWLWPMLW